MNLYRTLTGLRSPPAAPRTTPDMEPGSEEVTADADEPPENSRPWPAPPSLYQKAHLGLMGRRESLLTRQLHSETEHSEEDQQIPTRPSISGSLWSMNSVASTAELTSDDGRSMPSPAVSPPLAATYLKSIVPIHDKPSDKAVEIVGHDDSTQINKVKGTAPPEAIVEAGLGRRRCITFACGNKVDKPKVTTPTPTTVSESTSPPKRKCMIQFVCSGKPTDNKSTTTTTSKRPTSPPPPQYRRTGLSGASKAHRGSDSTVTHGSPQSIRKVHAVVKAVSPATHKLVKAVPAQRFIIDSDDSGPESTRFHEFATSDSEHEAWTKESTVHRSRLTISDTLKKENIIRKACEEVEEEAVEEGDDDDELDRLANLDDADDDDDDDDEDDRDEDDEDDQGSANVYKIDEESEDSDDGFHSDNEEGFAESDPESDGESDYEWWKPGGHSTAATSLDHIDRSPFATRNEDGLASSIGSDSSVEASPRSSRRLFHKSAARKNKTSHAVNIPRPDSPQLPDSTDFVAGTLDEDRPLEQAYLHNLKERAAAKHGVRPQDIDPTFPTSDPEMDEEDDDDLVDAPPSVDEAMMHGDLEEFEGDNTVRARRSPRSSRRNTNRSPAPPRLKSPPPPTATTRHRSPPPPKRQSQYTSPPPPTKRSHNTSPRRMRSPAPPNRKTSPANTRPATPAPPKHTVSSDTFGLPERVNVTHTASLPRSRAYRHGHLYDATASDAIESINGDAPRRGAIDIVKGLERKRQRRREKLHQKLCAKAAAKGEKTYRVKPGRGAERMREVGLELQRYKGKGQHILSV